MTSILCDGLTLDPPDQRSVKGLSLRRPRHDGVRVQSFSDCRRSDTTVSVVWDLNSCSCRRGGVTRSVLPIVPRGAFVFLEVPLQHVRTEHRGVFVQPSRAPASLCSLTAQKYQPLSPCCSFFTVSVPLAASGLVAENLSLLKFPKSWSALEEDVYTICFMVSPGSCLYQYIWKNPGPLVCVQFIVASTPSTSQSFEVWTTSLPPVRPEGVTMEDAASKHENQFNVHSGDFIVLYLQSTASRGTIWGGLVYWWSYPCCLTETASRGRCEELQVGGSLCDVILSAASKPSGSKLRGWCKRYLGSSCSTSQCIHFMESDVFLLTYFIGRLLFSFNKVAV